jgi:3-phenylpropionate/trans-cinnamate dioxygenase ferredoxin reductase subunit
MTAVASLFRLSFKVKYEPWLTLHDIFAPCVISGGFIHGFLIGPHVNGNILMETLWVVYALVALGALIYNRLIRAAVLKARAYRVSDVRQETDSVWTLAMTTPGKHPVYDYLPGQFHFLTLYRTNETRHEQHPFTISSSAAVRSAIGSSIKESGDYTATIGKSDIPIVSLQVPDCSENWQHYGNRFDGNSAKQFPFLRKPFS